MVGFSNFVDKRGIGFADNFMQCLENGVARTTDKLKYDENTIEPITEKNVFKRIDECSQAYNQHKKFFLDGFKEMFDRETRSWR